MVNIYCFHGCGQNTEIFKSLLSSLQKNLNSHNWVYLRGKYSKNNNGWGWYSYNDDYEECRIQDLINLRKLIENPENSILLGFSEGAQIALDLAQYITNIKGVIAMSPSYKNDFSNIVIKCPVVLITSKNDSKISKKYSDKWKKHIKNVIEINHMKSHKVYLPLKTRNIVRNVYKL
jgi:predicted esterase